MWTTHRRHRGGKQSRKNTILEKITEEIRAGRKMTQKKGEKEEKRRLWGKGGSQGKVGVKRPEEMGTGRKGHKKDEAEVGDPVGTY